MPTTFKTKEYAEAVRLAIEAGHSVEEIAKARPGWNPEAIQAVADSIAPKKAAPAQKKMGGVQKAPKPDPTYKPAGWLQAAQSSPEAELTDTDKERIQSFVDTEGTSQAAYDPKKLEYVYSQLKSDPRRLAYAKEYVEGGSQFKELSTREQVIGLGLGAVPIEAATLPAIKVLSKLGKPGKALAKGVLKAGKAGRAAQAAKGIKGVAQRAAMNFATGAVENVGMNAVIEAPNMIQDPDQLWDFTKSIPQQLAVGGAMKAAMVGGLEPLRIIGEKAEVRSASRAAIDMATKGDVDGAVSHVQKTLDKQPEFKRLSKNQKQAVVQTIGERLQQTSATKRALSPEGRKMEAAVLDKLIAEGHSSPQILARREVIRQEVEAVPAPVTTVPAEATPVTPEPVKTPQNAPQKAVESVQGVGGGVEPVEAVATPDWELRGSDIGDVYHGSSKKVRQVDFGKTQQRDSGFYGKGFYAATKPDYTKGYGGVSSKLALNPEARILNAELTPNEASPGLVDAVVEWRRSRGEAKAAERGKLDAFNEELARIRTEPLDWKNSVDEYARANGYDAVRYSDAEIVLHNENALAESHRAAPSAKTPPTAPKQPVQRVEGAGVSSEAVEAATPAPEPRKPAFGMVRNFTAGMNHGKMTFASELQMEAYDLGSKLSLHNKGGKNPRHIDPADLKHGRDRLGYLLGVTPDEASIIARDVYNDARAQMKGVKDGEARSLTDHPSLTRKPQQNAPVSLVDTPEPLPSPEPVSPSSAIIPDVKAEKPVAKSPAEGVNATGNAGSISKKELWQMSASGPDYAKIGADEADRAAFGFAADDIKTLDPKQLSVKWEDDFRQVKVEQESSGLSPKEWAKRIDLSEPIDVVYEDGQFKIDDGYHRWHAAKILNKPLNVEVTIKDNPHRTSVEAAAKQGKIGDGIKDYPDLQAKYTKSINPIPTPTASVTPDAPPSVKEAKEAWEMTPSEAREFVDRVANEHPQLRDLPSTYKVRQTIESLKKRLGQARHTDLYRASSHKSIADAHASIAKLEGQLKDAEGVLADIQQRQPEAIAKHNAAMDEWLAQNKEYVDKGIIIPREDSAHYSQELAGAKSILLDFDHAKLLKKALTEGKRVPDNVLTEYLANGGKLPEKGLHPEIAERYGEKVGEAKPIRTASDFEQAIVDSGKATAEEAASMKAILEANRKYHGASEADYYGEQWAEVTAGGTPAEGALRQVAAKPPKKSVTAYKLFRTMKTRPGEIFPLFIGNKEAVPVGEWITAQFLPTKGFAERPGWHVGALPDAPHLMSKAGEMPADRVWAEVEIPADVDWQQIADKSPTKDIKGQIPEGGHYRFKRPANQGGEWKIAGSMRVKRLLSADEVAKIVPRKLLQDSGDILKGSAEFLKDGRAVVRLFEKADISTLVHETAHVFRKNLKAEDNAILEKAYGIVDGKWAVKHEEQFARGFERYLRDGKAPTPELRAVFQNFKQWLTNIYQGIKGTPIEGKIPKEVREVYDRMLGKTETPQPAAKQMGGKVKDVSTQSTRSADVSKSVGGIDRTTPLSDLGYGAEGKASADAGDKYYVRHAEKGFTEVEGKPVTIPKFEDGDYFLHKAVTGDNYVVSEGRSGLLIESADTPEAAISAATERLTKAGKDKIELFVSQHTARSGVSPRHEGRYTPNEAIKVGDTVYSLQPGIGGIPIEIKGTVYKDKRGYRVKIDPNQNAGGAKTTALTLDWKTKSTSATSTVEAKPKPLRMDGKPRAEKVKAQPKPTPEFSTLHPKSQEKFNAAWDSKDADGMNALLDPANKGLRAEFESRSGTKLPKTISGTKQAVSEYFGKAQQKRVETYWRGDKAEYTGKVDDSLYELEIMEGHRKGDKVYTATTPEGVNPNVERKRNEWRAEQEDFRKLHTQPTPSPTKPEAKPLSVYADNPKAQAEFDAASERIKQRLREKKNILKDEAGELDVDYMRDLVIVGLGYAKELAFNADKWRKRMIETYGDGLDEYLDRAWKAVAAFDEPSSQKLPPVADASASGVSKARVEARRLAEGLDPLPQPEVRAKEVGYSKAKAAIDSGEMDIQDIARQIIDDSNPRTATDIEVGGFKYRLDQIDAKLKDATPEQAAKLMTMREVIHRAARRTSTDWHQLGESLQLTESGDALEIGPVLQRASENKGTALSVDEIKTLTDLQKKYDLLKVRNAYLEEMQGTQGTSKPRSIRMQKLDSMESAVLARIAKRKAQQVELGGKKGQGGFVYNPAEDFVDAVELAGIKLAKGITASAEFTAEMVKHWGEGVKPHLDGIRQAAEGKASADDMARRQAADLKRIETQRRNIEAQIHGTVKEDKPALVWTAERVRARAQLEEARLALVRKVDSMAPRDNVKTARKIALNILTLPTAWQAAWDNSYIGRQARLMLFHSPKSWGAMFKESHRALASEGAAHLIQDSIIANKHFPKAQQSGLEFTGLAKDTTYSNADEMAAYYRTGEEIPILGKALRPFDRAFTTSGNILRHDAFYRMVEAKGDTWTPQQYKDYANMLNIFTKRGNLGRAKALQPYLNAFMISSRNVAADWQLPLTMLQGDKQVRKLAAKAIATEAAAYVSLGLVLASAGVKVGFDPGDKKEFMVARQGDVRWDLLDSGRRTVITTAWAIGKATWDVGPWAEKDKNGKKIGAKFGASDAMDILISYGGKKAPGGSQTIKMLWTGKDYKGDPVSPKDAVLQGAVIPWNAGDLVDAWKQVAPHTAATMAAANFYGVGVRVYPDRPSEIAKKAREKFMASPEGREVERINKLVPDGEDTISLADPGRSLSINGVNVKMTDAEYGEYQLKVSAAIEKGIAKAVKTKADPEEGTPAFKDMPDFGDEQTTAKYDVIKWAVEDARETAREQFREKLERSYKKRMGGKRK